MAPQHQTRGHVGATGRNFPRYSEKRHDTPKPRRSDPLEPFLLPLVGCLGCVASLACSGCTESDVDVAHYTSGGNRSIAPLEGGQSKGSKLAISDDIDVSRQKSKSCTQKQLDEFSRCSNSSSPKNKESLTAPFNKTSQKNEEEGSLCTRCRCSLHCQDGGSVAAMPAPSDGNTTSAAGTETALKTQELLEHLVTDFSLRAVRFDDSDSRAGLPATLIHLDQGLHLKAEYHLDFRLQNLHFKLCTKENRFLMFFFIPMKHQAACYERVKAFLRKPDRAVVLQLSPDAPSDLLNTPLYLPKTLTKPLKAPTCVGCRSVPLFVGGAVVLLLADVHERDILQCSLKILQLYNASKSREVTGHVIVSNNF